MENASKALIIAGGVLVSMIIISLLVVFYNSITSLQSTKQSIKAEEQSAEFNKQFEGYAKNNIIGSEFLSLVNRVIDYNRRYTNDGYYNYTQMTLNITFNNSIDIITANNNILSQARATQLSIVENQQYNQDEFKSIIDGIQSEIDRLGSYRTTSGRIIDMNTVLALRTVQNNSLGTYTDNINNQIIHSEFTYYLSQIGVQPNEFNEVQNARTTYTNLKSVLTQIKSKRFNANIDQWQYDQNTGRLTDIVFTES